MIRTCIIGVSGYGRVHYDLLLAAQAADQVAAVGATIINQEEEAEKCAHLRGAGCRVFDDYRAMLKALAGSCDLCMIPTGTPLHRPMTIAALAAGMHVLVEKPAAGCVEDVCAMQDAARQAGKAVAVGYQHLYAPAAMAVKRMILEGAIGRLESIKCLALWPRDHAYYGRNGWAGRLRENGTAVNDSPFNNALAHELMMMLFQAGPAEREAAMPVSVQAELYRANAIESADTACLHVETAEGVPIRFYVTHACRKKAGPEIHLRGSQGSIVMTHQEAVVTPDGKEPITISTEGAAGRRVMMAAVLDVARGGSSFVCDLELASRQTMVVSAAHQDFPIRSLRGEIWHSASGAPGTCIPGSEDALRLAFDRECMLTDVMPAAKEEAGPCAP